MPVQNTLTKDKFLFYKKKRKLDRRWIYNEKLMQWKFKRSDSRTVFLYTRQIP
jgi:hypothetical protein